MEKQKSIIIKGASQNNLQNIDVEIPKNQLVVITGISGSGKSSLAIDTIYAEGYRRYIENLSLGARSLLRSLKKTKVQKIINLSPAIAVSQKRSNFNPRSTVGTLSDVYDLLRFLMAKAAQPLCPQCKTEMNQQTEEEILMAIKKLPENSWVAILAPFDLKNKNPKEAMNQIGQMGFARARIDGKILKINEINFSELEKAESIEAVVDRFMFSFSKFDKERIVDSLQTALKISKGKALVLLDQEKELIYSKNFICPTCGRLLENFSARHFSFNLPEGACERCKGLGETFKADPQKIIPNENLSLEEGAIEPWSRLGKLGGNGKTVTKLKELSKKYNFSTKKPFKNLSQRAKKIILFGEDKSGSLSKNYFEGVAREIEKKYQEALVENQRNELEKYLRKEKCPQCQGFRLKRVFLGFSFLGKTFQEILEMEIDELVDFFESFEELSRSQIKRSPRFKIAKKIIAEIIPRLKNISEAGLGYLNLNRSTDSLSGGEFQRLRLSNQIYGGLSDVIYILDEPSIGLHSRDTAQLIKTLFKLKKGGNSVIVVEHDKDIIKEADFVIDLGPGAGEEGGKIIFAGTLDELKKAKTKTSQYVFGKSKKTSSLQKKALGKGKKEAMLEVVGVKKNNLKNVSVTIPLNRLVAVAGVSGSGKSSLVIDVIAKALGEKKDNPKVIYGEPEFKKIKGIDHISKVVVVDQSPIGKSSRSNAATYTGVFSYIRKLFAETEVAKKNGFNAGHFSFNMRGGRCEYCQGEGRQKVEMYLLEDVYAECQYCNGTRYSPKMLQVQYHGATIVDVLEMSVDYAFHFFHHHKTIKEKLDAMRKVGLGYLKLGQSATELSGGESQRIKLAADLAKKSNEKTLYIFDEPTVGLHLSDIDKLIDVLKSLVKMNCSVIVIEHNLDVIGQSDWVIELGPEGGKEGGKIVFEGTPEKLKKAPTWTGKFLKKYF